MFFNHLIHSINKKCAFTLSYLLVKSPIFIPKIKREIERGKKSLHIRSQFQILNSAKKFYPLKSGPTIEECVYFLVNYN